MSSLLRRLPLTRLLLLCGAVVAVGASGVAIASAVDTGPVPEPKKLAPAIHEALSAAPVEGVSASIQYTNHLLEGASLAGAAGASGELLSSPLLQGAEGRLWIAKDGRVRLELQADGGDTEVVLANHTLSIYGAAPNTVYRYTLPQKEEETEHPGGERHVPTEAQIEEGISHLSQHATVTGATPTDVAGRAAYTARIAPKETGSLLGAAELSWDAVHGVPLRAAIYSSQDASPVIELAATKVSYGPVENSVFEISPAPGDKIVGPHHAGTASEPSSGATGATETTERHPKLTTIGHGITSVLALETPAPADGANPSPALPAGLQKVDINGSTAEELPTALGTLLSFDRNGVSYLLVGAVKPEAVEAAARGL
jgi:outer membrane lipoprotein-sorting protein